MTIIQSFHFTIDEDMIYFKFGAITNNAAMKFCSDFRYPCAQISIWSISRSEIAGLQDRCISTWEDIIKQLSKMVTPT